MANLGEVGHIVELSVKSSKENTEIVSLFKSGNKVVEVGWIQSKIEAKEGTTEANWVPILNG